MITMTAAITNIAVTMITRIIPVGMPECKKLLQYLIAIEKIVEGMLLDGLQCY